MQNQSAKIPYEIWKKDCSLSFDSQQENALRNTEGTVLLLAVPGSGKTTALIGRLGYLVHCQGEDPRNILAITYTAAAAAHMKEVYIRVFGNESGNQISFLTINSLCWRIVLQYYRSKGREISVLDEKTQRKWIREFLKDISEESFSTEADILNIQTSISLVKNRLMSREEIERTEWEIKSFPVVYERYQTALVKNRMADYDDQMIFAMKILKSNPELLKSLHNRFRFICVDEAQDTSFLQHQILSLLKGERGNLFLVGDEDQSIYGYRGACPKALLDMHAWYPNVKVMKLETNYRSLAEITDRAQAFIEKNRNRTEKTMRAYRGTGGSVNLVNVKNRGAQLKEAVIFSKGTGTRAILYRNNDSASVLIDVLDRNGIPWTLNKSKDTFFTNRVATDIRTFLEFALDHNNPELFQRCVTKVSLYFKAERAKAAVMEVKKTRRDLLDEFIVQNQYQKGSSKYQIDQTVKNARKFKSVFMRMPSLKPTEAIRSILSLGYAKYMKDCGLSAIPLENLQMIASKTASIREFLKRLDEVKALSVSGTSPADGVILSTIHSAKGMEYDRVLLFDVVDGILPGCRESDDPVLYEEERRLFYVAMTRAKEELTVLCAANKEHSFANEIRIPGAKLKEADGTGNPLTVTGRKKNKKKGKMKPKRIRDITLPAKAGDYLMIEDNKTDEMIQILITEKTPQSVAVAAWKMKNGMPEELCTKEITAHQDERRWRLVSRMKAKKAKR